MKTHQLWAFHLWQLLDVFHIVSWILRVEYLVVAELLANYVIWTVLVSLQHLLVVEILEHGGECSPISVICNSSTIVALPSQISQCGEWNCVESSHHFEDLALGNTEVTVIEIILE